MANVKKGHLAKAPQWWKHLRSFKRTFWRRNRQAEQREVKRELGRDASVDPGSRMR
jgi:hypothetical protein